jgi:putative transcriptional regulator
MTDLRHVARFGPALRENGGVRIDYSTGKLLVATPRTVGEVFWHSVVLVLQHDEGGAQGVVLNRPLAAPVSAVLPDWQDFVTDPATVFQGGPVAMDSALGLVTVPGDKQEEPLGVRLLFGGIGIVDLDVPPVVVMPEVAGLRIFAGYAGWSPGQLEQEIRDGGWYVVESEARDAFNPEPETLWTTVLRRQRGNLALVASFPEDPTMN